MPLPKGMKRLGPMHDPSSIGFVVNPSLILQRVRTIFKRCSHCGKPLLRVKALRGPATPRQKTLTRLAFYCETCDNQAELIQKACFKDIAPQIFVAQIDGRFV